ncbi:MAG TPA: DUF2218 domain-containing protein [Thermomonas sp.]|nr:DUF2218 domain-containing protein [Thermomonas sp.]
MPAATATIDTPEASRLIRRLCTHWGHKFTVEFDDTHGVVSFDDDVVLRLDAHADALQARIEACDPPALERFQGVVENHLQRMARAGELAFHWQAGND